MKRTFHDIEVFPAVKVRVQLDVDVDRIAQTLGHAAYYNKSKRSHEIGGLVVCKVIQS